jgi:hypothetical protein
MRKWLVGMGFADPAGVAANTRHQLPFGSSVNSEGRHPVASSILRSHQIMLSECSARERLRFIQIVIHSVAGFPPFIVNGPE